MVWWRDPRWIVIVFLLGAVIGITAGLISGPWPS